MKEIKSLHVFGIVVLMCLTPMTVFGLSITGINPSNYTIQYNSLAVGQLVYTDRAYTFTNVASLAGSTYIKTANDDKYTTGDSFLTFDINQDCTVYVALDTHTTKPSWLNTFFDTGEDIITSNSTYHLYSKVFGIGTVILGGNGGGVSSSMYSVVVVPIPVTTPPGQASNPSPINGETGVSYQPTLNWTAGTEATFHDVYFGTTNPPAYIGEQADTTYSPGDLELNTTYYWRIDEINSLGTTAGIVWSFMTETKITSTIATALWKFDESTGFTASDSSGNGNDATLFNMDNSDWVTGQYGNALNFDGSNDYVQAPSNSILEGGSQLVAEAWVKTTDSISEYGAVVGTGDSGWVMARHNNGIIAGFWMNTGLLIVENNAVIINDGQWHHVAAIYDGSAAYLYVDDTVASNDQKPSGGTITPGGSIQSSGYSVHIGKNPYTEANSSDPRYWNGLIDELAIYNNVDEYLYHRDNPNKAWGPSPANGATNISIEQNLSWATGDNASTHDFYFGTDETAVSNAQRPAGDKDGNGTVNIDDLIALASQWVTKANFEDFAVVAADWGLAASAEFIGNQVTPFWDPGTLSSDTTYYWRIDEVNPSEPDSPWTGQVWSFSTPSPTPIGSLIHDPEHPAWLKYAEGGPLFMCGPGDPEDFLYRGIRNADGTRNGDQMTLINKLIPTGANCIYFQAVKSNGGDGDSTMNPFVDSNVNGLLDEDILDQWETWFTAMDDNGIVIFFMFYDDYANPFGGGDTMPAQEIYMVDTLVNRFEHHKNLIWIVSEEYQKALTTARVSNIAARIQFADNYNHPVGTHQLPGTSFSFNGDDNMDQFAMQLNDATTSYIHQSCLDAWNNVGGQKSVNLAEIYEWNTIPQTGAALRQKAWSAAMAGAYSMWLWMDIASTPITDLQICGRVVNFMESTKFYMTQPSDSLKRGTTDYVLADPGNVYIVYSNSAGTQLGVNVQAGEYSVKWYDPIDGDWSDQGTQTLTSGDRYFTRPSNISSTEAVLYLEKTWATYGVEAENYDSQTGAGTWVEATATSGYVGSAYMADTRTDINQATATLTFDIDFPSAGTYYCYVRTWASDSLNNGFHLEFDGSRLSDDTDAHGTREAVYVTKQSIWNWATQWQYGEGDVEGPLSINVSSAGTHTLGITSRDPGFRFDRIIITDYMVGGLTYSTGAAPAFLNVLETVPNGYN